MLEQLKQTAQKIAPHGAANAAVAHFDDFLVGRNQQMVIDTDFTEFVDNDGDPAAMICGKNSIQQCGFSGAEKSREHSDRHSIVVGYCHSVNPRVNSKK
jgi:hypothetical protein